MLLEERTYAAKRLYGLEYWNTLTECLFNLFILYYFVAISKKQNDIDKRVNTNDDSRLLLEDHQPHKTDRSSYISGGGKINRTVSDLSVLK